MDLYTSLEDWWIYIPHGKMAGFIYLMGKLVDLYISWENWWRSLETCRVIFTRSLHSTRGCVSCNDVHLVFVISLSGPSVLSTRGLGYDHCEQFHQVFVMCLPGPSVHGTRGCDSCVTFICVCLIVFTRSLHSTRGCVSCDDVHLVFVISLSGPSVLSTRGLGCDHCEQFHQVFVMCLPGPSVHGTRGCDSCVTFICVCLIVFTRSLHSTRGCDGCEHVHLVFGLSCLPGPYTVPEGVMVVNTFIWCLACRVYQVPTQYQRV